MFNKTASQQMELWNILRNQILEAHMQHSGFFPFIIGIGGAGCMGKSWFAQELTSYSPSENVVLFDLDGYLLDVSHRQNLTG